MSATPVARAALLGALCLGLAIAVTGCTEVCYVLQAAAGQDELGYLARPLDEALADRTTPREVRAVLAHVPAVKRYAVESGLTPTDSYEDYVALGRPAVVWVVSACRPLAFEAKTWWFPIVGTVPYLGWFRPADAARYAGELAADGWDVDVRSSSAYSTLGWFPDPVLSTMIPPGDAALGELVNTVLHESVHATLYVPSQSSFNESVASFVGDVLTERYLSARLSPAAPETRAFRRGRKWGELRQRRMHAVYLELEKLYASTLTDAEKLERKGTLLTALRVELGFRRPISNATLLGFRTYNSGMRELEGLFSACAGSVPRFMAALGRLRPEDFGAPAQEDIGGVLEPLKSCPQ
ncbi:MAG: aminopeptidase [Polyangiaceae bacterium]|nr:aminopeptidase [Polyangiaceae bacterium]